MKNLQAVLAASNSRNPVKSVNTKPVFYPVDINELYFADYQRGVNYRKVKRYYENYDADIYGIIIVSHRDGKYYVIDGQHRVEVAKRLGLKSIMCQILEGLTYEDEADKFYKLNTTRTPAQSMSEIPCSCGKER